MSMVLLKGTNIALLLNNQIKGEDYNKTFAPVVKMTTVRTLLRMVAANQWEIYQMDVQRSVYEAAS